MERVNFSSRRVRIVNADMFTPVKKMWFARHASLAGGVGEVVLTVTPDHGRSTVTHIAMRTQPYWTGAAVAYSSVFGQLGFWIEPDTQVSSTSGAFCLTVDEYDVL